jgi:general secretion pathway protein F
MVYPALLMATAGAVILTMLLWVVPQFEGLFSDAGAQLPFMTRLVIGISHAVRRYGAVGLAVAVVLVVVVERWTRGASARAVLDRWALALPQVGDLLVAMELGRYTRVLGSLVEGGAPLPEALVIARRSLTNARLAAAAGRVAAGVNQGAGLTASLAGERVFPRTALSFIRTGEETARLGLMLGRLADVFDQEVRRRIDRLIAVLTPLITVLMGAIVATVIASIMTAILGFNDLALPS